MASAVKAIKAKNAARAGQLALEKEEKKRKQEEMIAKMTSDINAGGAPPKLTRRMTKEEKEVAALHKAFLRNQAREIMPKVKGYGRLSLHWPRKTLLPYQLEACKFYNTGLVTWGVAAVIIGNFLAICYEKEIDPYPDHLKQHQAVWEVIDVFSNIVFIFEIIINYYGAGTRRFWSSGWNIFDLIVVVVGILTMTKVPLGPFSMLKIFRAFRVFRLFKRIESLNKIIVALANAVPGVVNAFVIMLIVMAIYAIIAVDYFRDFGGNYKDPHYQTILGNPVEGETLHNVTSITARGFVIGDEYYGTFSRALYSLFQTLTGESWSEALARPLVFGYSPKNAAFVSFFFVSFLLIMQIVLVNVVVAVLLEKFVTDDADEEDDDDSDDGGQDLAERIRAASDDSHGMAAVRPAAASPAKAPEPKAAAKAPEPKAPQNDAEVELMKLKESVNSLHATLDLIVKALETEGKVFSGSTGSTDTGSSSGATANTGLSAASAPGQSLAGTAETKDSNKAE